MKTERIIPVEAYIMLKILASQTKFFSSNVAYRSSILMKRVLFYSVQSQNRAQVSVSFIIVIKEIYVRLLSLFNSVQF